jgi:hypothetical protein
MSNVSLDEARELRQALPEVFTVALTLWGEARSQYQRGVGWVWAPAEARLAVASVIRNRFLAPKRFGATWKDVCLKPAAFECWLANGSDNSNALYERARALLLTGEANPLVMGDPILRECIWIAEGVIAGRVTDRVKGACHYHADWMNPFPAWSKKAGQPIAPIVVVAGHLFYAGIR